VRDHLRGGIAIHNAGHHHAAHDAWEQRWLEVKADVDGSTASPETVPDLPGGTTEPSPAADERLLHGLIQFTAAVHHLDNGNWAGAEGLAERARGYLAPLAPDYRAVNVGPVREYLGRVGADPRGAADEAVIDLTHEGRAVGLGDLSVSEATVAAEVLAEEFDAFDEEVVGLAVEYARADLEGGDEGSRFVALVVDFVSDEGNRRLVYDRLRGHVERRRAKGDDVEDLFRPG